MELESVIENAFLVKPEDTLSHVTSQMEKARKYEAFVFDGDLKGIVTLDEIIKRRVSEPQKTKISYFMKHVARFPVDTPVGDVINYMLVSEYRSLPVEKDGEIHAVSKPRLLNFVKDEVFEGKKAKDVMQFPYCASEGDSLSTIISMMKDVGSNRVPILNGKGKLTGLADSMSMIGIIMGKNRSKRGQRFGDKTKLGEIGIDKFMKTNIIRVGPETELKKVVKKVYNRDVCTVIVEKNDKFLGMITIKDIFKLIGKSLETVYVRVSGLDDEDSFIKMKIDEMVENIIRKLLKVLTIRYIAIHVDTRRTEGRRTNYSAHGRIVTEKWNFHASESGWDPTKIIKLLLGKLEREVHKKMGKSRGR